MPDTPTAGASPSPQRRDLPVAAAAITATAHAIERTATGSPPNPDELLDALVLLRWAQSELAELEPRLIAAARAAGVSWQALAPALGVASRQAAERRYLRSASASTNKPGDTREARVQAERDRRAAHRAATRWANDNTADLRRLAGQITALTDLGDAAAPALARLHQALGEPDASTLPGLLAATHAHLPHHPGLAAQIDTVTMHTDQILRQTGAGQRHPAGRRDGDELSDDGITGG
jgi:hypothetical protein